MGYNTAKKRMVKRRSTQCYFITIVAAIAILCSCQNKKQQTEGYENLPQFEKCFSEKVVVTPHGDTLLTFSSFEEAEWKLRYTVYEHSSVGEFNKALETVLLSDPSSMDYPFDLISSELIPWADSEDGMVRCVTLQSDAAYQLPMMLVCYRANGEVCLAEDGGFAEDCYYCLIPDTVFSFKTDRSTVYLVYGFAGNTCSGGDAYRLRAYELDSTGLHPAFIFPPGIYNDQQDLYTEICINDEMYDDLWEENFSSLVRFDKANKRIYMRKFEKKDADEYGCTTKMTNQYLQYVWDGEQFVLEK